MHPGLETALGIVPGPRREHVTEQMLALVDDDAAVLRSEAALPFRNPDAQLVRADDVPVDLKERHVVIEHLMQQDDELHEIRARLLPEPLFTPIEKIGHERGNAVRQRVGIEVVVEQTAQWARKSDAMTPGRPRRPPPR